MTDTKPDLDRIARARELLATRYASHRRERHAALTLAEAAGELCSYAKRTLTFDKLPLQLEQLFHETDDALTAFLKELGE